jgi:hypothetical protein
MRGADAGRRDCARRVLADGRGIVIQTSGVTEITARAHPMAVVILGGLVTSTLLNLFLLPPLYLRFGRQEPAGEEPAL